MSIGRTDRLSQNADHFSRDPGDGNVDEDRDIIAYIIIPKREEKQSCKMSM